MNNTQTTNHTSERSDVSTLIREIIMQKTGTALTDTELVKKIIKLQNITDAPNAWHAPLANYSLGLAYANGIGVRKDAVIGYAYLNLAYKEGVLGNKKLGDITDMLENVRKNIATANAEKE